MLLPFFNKNGIEAGCDEAGRGPLVGPVFASSVIWPKSLLVPEIDDSKKLSEKKRLFLRDYIERNAIDYHVAMVDIKEIARINILNAAIKAMHLALDGLTVKFNRILVDGNRFKDYKNIEYHTIVKGDGKYLSIAAASILAKTYRDEYMQKLDKEYPLFQWSKNKGYGTKVHREAILKYGLTEYHRKKFCEKILEKKK